MALANLTTEIQSLSISEPHFLLFEPNKDCEWLKQSLDDIPRYLFRITSPRSDGTTDEHWTKSKDARYDSPDSKIDVLATKDKSKVARMLNRHLQWRGTSSGPDNLVSWTSSLLFALQFMFYRHYSSKDRSSLATIYLCVVDTTAFPKGVFIRDMDMIRIFRRFDRDLQNFEILRTRRHRALTGSYYFGEYFSQGALKIENKCQIVSAQAVVDNGLFDIRPEFSELLPPKDTPWANKVIAMREPFYLSESPNITGIGIRAALAIAELFGGPWKLPLAASFIALLPSRDNDGEILQAFTDKSFTISDKENCSHSKTKLMDYDLLPEVKQFAAIMKTLYEDFCLTKLRNCLGEIEANLRSAILMAPHKYLDPPSNPTAVSATHGAVLRKLDIIEMLSSQIRSEISS